jgi:hypothetical protein
MNSKGYLFLINDKVAEVAPSPVGLEKAKQARNLRILVGLAKRRRQTVSDRNSKWQAHH